MAAILEEESERNEPTFLESYKNISERFHLRFLITCNMCNY